MCKKKQYNFRFTNTTNDKLNLIVERENQIIHEKFTQELKGTGLSEEEKEKIIQTRLTNRTDVIIKLIDIAFDRVED